MPDETQQKILAMLDGLSSQVRCVSTQVGGLTTRVDGLTTRLDGLTTRVDGLSSQVSDLTAQVGGFATRMDGLTTQVVGVVNAGRPYRGRTRYRLEVSRWTFDGFGRPLNESGRSCEGHD